MVKVALVGAGYWGSKIQASLSNNKSVTDTVIIDIRNGDSLDDIPIEYKCAIVATPLWDHFDTARELLQRGFDCYIEKPLAETKEHCEQLRDMLDDQILMVGHIFLYHPGLDIVKQNLNQIGKVKHITSQRLNWGIYQTKTTPLLSLLPHDVSIVQDILGIDHKLLNVVHNSFNNDQQPDYVSFNLQFGDVTCNVTGSWYWPERVRKLTVIGTQGHIVWDDVINMVSIYQGTVEDKKLTELTVLDCLTPDMSVTPLEREIDHFIDCVVTRNTPRSDVNNAIEVASLLDEVATYLG